MTKFARFAERVQPSGQGSASAGGGVTSIFVTRFADKIRMTFSKTAGRAIVMGVATLVGSLLPAIPFAFLSRGPAMGVAALITLACVAAIARVRSTAKALGDSATAVFGAYDGLTCALTVIGAELWTNQPLHVIVVSAASLAGGGAVSMAMGEWLSDRVGVKPWLAYAQTIGTLIAAAAVGIALSVVAGSVG